MDVFDTAEFRKTRLRLESSNLSYSLGNFGVKLTVAVFRRSIRTYSGKQVLAVFIVKFHALLRLGQSEEPFDRDSRAKLEEWSNLPLGEPGEPAPSSTGELVRTILIRRADLFSS